MATDDEGAQPEAENEYPDSGPFCRHWGDPVDCDEKCTCGHTCGQHSYGDSCDVPDCTCDTWQDAHDADPLP